jgi:DNA-binding MurR/RpiR family transcriptional regulator
LERDVLSLISTKMQSFSKGQRKIARFILDYYDKAAFMTASRLGETVGISESTVVRFAADIGYKGYPEMRKALQDMIKNRLTSVQRIEVSKGFIENNNIPAAVFASDMEKIRSTLEDFDKSSFDAAVDAIVNAKHVYILGLRSSASLASFMGFYLKLLLPGVTVVNESFANNVFEQIMRIEEGDVFIGISFPRYSKRTIKAAKFAKDNGATVIGITDTETSLMAQISTIKLYVRSEMVSFVDSLVAPLSLINALIIATADKADEDISSVFLRLEQIWSDYEVYEKSGN